MKKLPLLFAAFLVVSASGLRAGEPSDIHTLLRRLDGLLDRREEFLLRHEARLDSLKSLLRGDTLAERSPTRSHCYSPWQTVPVKVDGRFSFCDCQPETVIGDLLASPIETLWNGPRLRELRHQMHAAPSPACLACPRF